MSAIDRGVAPRTLQLPSQADTDGLGRHDRAVLDALRATTAHPTAAQLYGTVRARFPRVGQATVYRALARLLAAGLVVDVGRDALGRHYDARTDRHDHAICAACGWVCDLPAQANSLPPEVLAPLIAAGRQVGMRVTSYEVRLYGLCATCANQRTAPEGISPLVATFSNARSDTFSGSDGDPSGMREGETAHE